VEMFDEQIATLIKADGTVEQKRGSAALPRPAGRWTPSHRHAGLLCDLHSTRTSQEWVRRCAAHEVIDLLVWETSSDCFSRHNSRRVLPLHETSEVLCQGTVVAMFLAELI